MPDAWRIAEGLREALAEYLRFDTRAKPRRAEDVGRVKRGKGVAKRAAGPARKVTPPRAAKRRQTVTPRRPRA